MNPTQCSPERDQSNRISQVRRIVNALPIHQSATPSVSSFPYQHLEGDDTDGVYTRRGDEPLLGFDGSMEHGNNQHICRRGEYDQHAAELPHGIGGDTHD